jgi:ketosteroid isomerase-like protein
MPTAIATSVIDRFVEALAARDLAAAVDLYAPAAVFEPHVPGWDGVTDDRDEIGAWLDSFFISRESFRVVDREIVRQGDVAALRIVMRWRDADAGRPCLCFQSHFFDLDDEGIRLHRMYCAGVRVEDLETDGHASEQ